MVYQEHRYGFRKMEIKKLLRKRLGLKDKIRYHRKIINTLTERILVVERVLNDTLNQEKCKDKVYIDKKVYNKQMEEK